MMDLLYSNLIEYKSVKDVPPSHFTEQFSKDMQSTNNNTKCKVQWKFDGDKLANEYKKIIHPRLGKAIKNGVI